jgi:hypothetical protein
MPPLQHKPKKLSALTTPSESRIGDGVRPLPEGTGTRDEPGDDYPR